MRNTIPTLGTISWGRRLMPAAVALGLVLVFGLAQSGFAQSDPPLNFGNNYFVTGDYALGGVGLVGQANLVSQGFATGTISIGGDTNPGVVGTNSVPKGAHIVAAWLYWETFQIVGGSTGQNGFFRPVFNGGPSTGYPIRGTNLSNPNAPVFWGNTGCASSTATSKQLVAYRADVRGFLPRDANGNVLANGTYEVTLPSQSNGYPLTVGATLLLVYRVISPNFPLYSVVINDGITAPTNTSLTTTQTIQGFYQAAANPVSKLTIITGNGQKNLGETVSLSLTSPSTTTTIPLPSLYGSQPPFPGAYPGGLWDNPTWFFGPTSATTQPPNPINNPKVPENAFSATTVITDAKQGCVAPAAIIFSTTVHDDDKDGILKVWKDNQGYIDVATGQAVSLTGPLDPVTHLPVDPPKSGQQDVFIQLDHVVDSNGDFTPNLQAVKMVKDAFKAQPHNIHLHITGGNAIQVPTCMDNSNDPLCQAGLVPYPNQPVITWRSGFEFVKDQLVDPTGNAAPCATTPIPANCMSRFPPAQRDSYHYVVFGDALGVANWGFLGGTLTDSTGTGAGVVMQVGSTVAFQTSTPHGLCSSSDPLCSKGPDRVTISDAITNPNLNGTHLVTSVACPPNPATIPPTGMGDCTVSNIAAGPYTFTIDIGTSAGAQPSYTQKTDPNLAVASGQGRKGSGFSDVGGSGTLVTLGHLWGADGQKATTQAGTLMHELGHNLGLHHGGSYYDNLAHNPQDYTPTIEANCKPNYLSVMNYMFQFVLLGPNNVLDFSSQQLNTLDENLLSPALISTTDSSSIAFQTSIWYDTVKQYVNQAKASHHCNNTPNSITDVTQTMYWHQGPPPPFPLNSSTIIPSPAWSPAPLDINFDGKIETSDFRGYNDWANVDLRQIGGTGIYFFGLGPGGGFNGPGGGFSGPGGGFNGPGGGFNGPGGGFNGPGGGFSGPGGGFNGPGASGLEIDFSTANAVTYPPRNLTASEGASPRTITLNWTQPIFGQIVKYKIYRSDAGGAFNLIGTVSGAPPATTFQDNVTCNPGGYRYFVTAVIISDVTNAEQESVPSNTVSTSGQTGVLLTGCYTNTPPTVTLSNLSFSPNVQFIQGIAPFPTITWSLQTDDTGAFVGRLAANTSLVAVGPTSNDMSCGPVTQATPRTTLLLNGTVTAQSGASTFGVSAGPNFQFTFNWDTTQFNAGCYFFTLNLDSGQSETTGTAPNATTALTLLIFVSDMAPHVITTSLPDATAGVPYMNTVFESGGITTGPNNFSWTIVPNSVMPGASSFLAGNPGISFLPNAPGITNGTLSGTPCVPGTYTFMVKVTDSVGNFGMQTLMLRVLAAPVPQANQPLVPESSVPGASGFTLTVNGTGFVSCSAVLWNGSPRTTTFNSAKQLTATILPADVLTFGTASISVANTGSPSSNVDFFQITNPTTAVSLSRVDIATGASPIGLISADFNADGKIDLAIANSGGNTVSILLGNGDGTFTAKPTLATGSGPFSLAAGDFNNDGKLDLAVANFASGAVSTVSIFIGNGDGTFKPGVTYAVGGGPISVVTGDFNRDGKLDLAVANQNDHSVSILLGNGDGTFQAQKAYAAVIAGAGTLDVANVTVGDFNGDGKLDLAVTNPSTDQVSILLGNGDGTFQNPVSYSTGPAGSHPIAVSAADFNGDGKLDLAVTNLNTRNVAIFLGNGDGTFQPQVSYSTTGGAMIGPVAITTGDFNGDGRVDLAIANQRDNSVSILLGNGNGTFQNPLEFTTGNFSAGVAAGDFNGDGRLDVAVADFSANAVSIMLQPQVLLMPSALAFGNVSVGGTPITSAVGLTNNGPGALTISTIVINPGAFSQTNNCPITPATLAAGATCTINVSFLPTVTGVQGSTLVITDSALDNPQNVSLSGTGTP